MSSSVKKIKIPMTERELIDRQHNDGCYYLMQVGLFWHAYEEGAFALARITGYGVRRLKRRDNTIVHLLGFPDSSLKHVEEILCQHSISLDVVNGDTRLLCFCGGDGSFDETFVREHRKTPSQQQGQSVNPGMDMESGVKIDTMGKQLVNEVRDYDLLNATPIDALMFVTKLKRMLSSAALLTTLLLCATPVLAQSGIDSLKNGGSLGGDTPPGGTGVERVVIDSSAQPHAKGSQLAYFTLDGRRIDAPRRGEAYIIRWREQGTWRTRKTVGK